MAFRYRQRIAFLVLALASVVGSARAQDWKLVWEDTFDGESLDPERWAVRSGEPRVSGGRLILDGDTSTTIMMTSANGAAWTYGRFAIRAKLPRSGNVEATVALVPAERSRGLLAVASLSQWTEGAAEVGLDFGEFRETFERKQPAPDLESDGFHLVEMDWSEGLFRWRVDGRPVMEETKWFSPRGPYPAPYNRPARLRLWLSSTGAGDALEVESVRVYQRATPPPRSPFHDPPPSIPGTIEAEEFDLGGQGVTYLDCDPKNEGKAFRTDTGVDIEPCKDVGEGYHVAYTHPGEWLEYTVLVRRTGLYRVDARVSSLDAGGGLAVKLRDGELSSGTGPAFFPPTGSWQRWVTIPVGTLRLEQGRQILRAEILAPFFNLNRLELTRVEDPPSAPRPWMLF